MKIQCESTIDEAVDAQIRLLKTSKVFKKFRLYEFIWVPILFIGFYFGIPDERNIKLIFAFIASISFIIIHLATHKKTLKKRIQKLIVEQLGTDKPVQCEYEFSQDALIFRKLGTEIRFNWDSVKEIIENEEDIEFRIDKGGIAIIPNRIFISAHQKEEWLKFARSKVGFI
jgi:hypothetical protein